MEKSSIMKQIVKRIGKNDMIFIGVLLMVGIAVLFAFSLHKEKGSGWVIVTCDGEEYGRYCLKEDQTVEITDAKGQVTNVLVIAEGKADMAEADCPDKLCVHQKAIAYAGENLVCLPNRVVVTVEAEQENGLDGFAQ